MATQAKFRFAYFTAHYIETCAFYTNLLEFDLAFSWDRDHNDKGTVFQAGLGLIEVLKLPDDTLQRNEGLDYRAPQGAFMVVHVPQIDERYKKYKEKKLVFKQEIVNQPWGHRSFSVVEPNGLVLLFIQE